MKKLFLLIIIAGQIKAQTCNSLSTMTDSRDGQVYTIVQIGIQWWMAQNLNYGTMLPYSGQVAQTKPGQKYCYNNIAGKGGCATYGGLYEFAEAINFYGGSTNSTTDGNSTPSIDIQGVCPSGWHLPSDAEWCTMENFVEQGADPNCNLRFSKIGAYQFEGTNIGSDLRSSTIDSAAWTTPVSNGPTPNSVCFSALAAGVTGSGVFSDLGGDGYWWTSSEFSVPNTCSETGQSAWMRSVINHSTQVIRDVRYKSTGNSVRCVKEITTSIPEHSSINTISVYPNPSNGNFVVESNTSQQQVLQVFDITDKLLLTEILQNGKATINAGNLTPGVYNICITSDNQRTNKRLVIIK